MQAPENTDQAALRKWITAGLQIEEVRALYGDAGYLLSNMIAKYTLAASEYRLSEKAHQWFLDRSVDLSQEYARSRYYGKGSSLIYEHSVPASVVRGALLEVPPTNEGVETLLRQSGSVIVVLRSEDDLLSSHGLSKKMPSGWKYGDDPFARYTQSGIALSDVRLRVKGKIRR